MKTKTTIDKLRVNAWSTAFVVWRFLYDGA